jgi:alkane 1-monooxygenase
MKMFTYLTSTGAKATYVDRKYPFWSLALVYALLPFVGIALHAYSGKELALFIPISFTYVVFPLIDLVLGEDVESPPEEVVPQLEEHAYYRVLTYAIVPISIAVMIGAAYWIGTHRLTWGVLALGMGAGVTGGLCLTTGHELGHKHTTTERWLTKILLAVPAYGHFWVDHNRGHHREVATPEDPVSARMGESIYRFAARELPGAFRRAWQSEAERLRRRGQRVWSLQNEIIQSYAMSALFQGGLSVAFGPSVLLFFLVSNAQAWWLLTSANYVEHYGLLRQRDARGRYERCEPHHSWNCNRVCTNLLLFHLERHSDHHSHPRRRFQSLRHFENLPQLPSGYLGMFSIALVPWLWFKIMDPRLLALKQVQGDLDKINIDPKHRARILARYGRQKESVGTQSVTF